MIRKLPWLKISCALLLAVAFGAVAQSAQAAATIVIQNGDAGTGKGFDDPTPASPVGNNTGTTLGQQRLNTFQFAANLWGATLNSSVTITISSSWANLDCSSMEGVLGRAGSTRIFRNFTNAPFTDTWYSGALANALSGTDQRADSAEIDAQFNLRVGTPGCLDASGQSHFYLGLDGNYGTDIDLVTVLLHEFGHGLGFQSFTNSSNGQQAGSMANTPNSGFPSIYDFFLRDNSSEKLWKDMTDAERQASAINTGNLVWTGPQVGNDVRNVLGTPRLRVNAPGNISGLYSAGGAGFTADLRARPLVQTAGTANTQVTGNVVYASPTLGCSAIAGGVAGNIALIDRGSCNFTVKVKNAQDAGAIGVIVANNVGPSPPNVPAVIQMGGSDSSVRIPSMSISLADGNTLKSQLSSGLNTSLLIDGGTPTGTDAQGRPFLYAPNPIESGSSVSHWDQPEFPDLLMEPNISADVIHGVALPADLTLSQLRDVGWPGNPIGDVPFFVRQHYLDFLNRPPDSSGFQFWVSDVFGCGIDAGCAEVHRINVSAAFFLSIEFQQTGNLVYKMYKAGFGNVPGTPVAVRRANFLADSQTIQSTPFQIIVGQGNWQSNLETNKQSFALAFVQRPGFPNQSDAASFVDNLFANAGVAPSGTERQAAINAFNGAGGGNAGRAAALRSVAESSSVSARLFNEAFVLMQYFGYLQRDPDAAPELTRDYQGYNFWLNKLNSFNGNFIAAEMVKAFLNSTEYRGRFGNP